MTRRIRVDLCLIFLFASFETLASSHSKSADLVFEDISLSDIKNALFSNFCKSSNVECEVGIDRKKLFVRYLNELECYVVIRFKRPKNDDNVICLFVEPINFRLHEKKFNQAYENILIFFQLEFPESIRYDNLSISRNPKK